MARSIGTYRSDKRRKELARLQKQEEKRKRRLEKIAAAAQDPRAQDAQPPLNDALRPMSGGDQTGGPSGSG